MRWLLLVLALTSACGGGGEAAQPSSSLTPANATGLITEVRFEGDQVVGFVLDARGETFDLLIDPEYDYGFNLRHLEKHRVDELPVHVEIAEREGKLYAHEVLDA